MEAEFHPEASAEFQAASAYYENEVPGLGEALISEVERVTELMQTPPAIGKPIDGVFRRVMLLRFPFSIIYCIESENFRAAFYDFDFDRVARFGRRDINRLLKDEGIVRHRGKIEATINNAKRVQELVKQEGSLVAFIWRYEPGPKTLAKPQSVSTSAESIALSKDLKKLGWKFFSPATTYALVERARKKFKRPGQ